MKRIISIVLALSLVMCLMATAVAADEKPLCTIGMISYDTSDATINTMYHTIERAFEAWNVDVIYASADMNDSQATITAIETLINQGVDGVLLFAQSEESANAVIAKMCADAGVYLAINDAYALVDTDSFQMLKDNPYLVALAGAEQVSRGYKTVEILAEAGCENIGLLYAPVAMGTYGARQAGAFEAAEDYGITIVNVQDNIMQFVSPAAGYDTVSNMLTAYPEIDGIAIGLMTQMCMSGVEKAAAEAGNVLVSGLDFDENTFTLMDSGAVVGFNATPFGQFYYSLVYMVNKILGTPLTDELALIEIPTMNFTSTEEAADYYEIWDGGNGYAFTDEEMRDMLVYYNPDFTNEQMQEIIANSFDCAAELAKR